MAQLNQSLAMADSQFDYVNIAGTYTFTAGATVNYADIGLLGAGGSGGASHGAGHLGSGGGAGAWNFGTFSRGGVGGFSAFPAGGVFTPIVVGAGGVGVASTAGANGHVGAATTMTGSGLGTYTAAGGAAGIGATASTTHPIMGIGPGGLAYIGDIFWPGGDNQTVTDAGGNGPGSGGAGDDATGASSTTGPGAPGAIYLVSRVH